MVFSLLLEVALCSRDVIWDQGLESINLAPVKTDILTILYTIKGWQWNYDELLYKLIQSTFPTLSLKPFDKSILHAWNG